MPSAFAARFFSSVRFQLAFPLVHALTKRNSLALGTQQDHIRERKSQMASAFAIATILFVSSVGFAILEVLGKEISIRRVDNEVEDNEEAGQYQEATKNDRFNHDVASEHNYRPQNAESERPFGDDGREYGYSYPVFVIEEDDVEYALHHSS